MALFKRILSVREIIALSLMISTAIPPLAAFAKEKESPSQIVPVNDMARRIEASRRAAAARAESGKKIESQSDDGAAGSSDSTAGRTQSAAVDKLPEGPAFDKNNGDKPGDLPEANRIIKSREAVEEAKVLKGLVTSSASKSPLLYDRVQEMPKGTTVNLVSLVNINSEVNQKGDDVWVRVGNDLHGPTEVAMPGGWYMHGVVTESRKARRGGFDGYVTVQFDKLVSPDKQLEVPFDAHITSKQTKAQAIAKHLAIDSVHVGYGAVGGSIMAVQFGGIGTAIATHGISVGVGAGIGATVGLIGAAKRKGSVSEIAPGDDMKMVFSAPISLPGFDSKLIPSAKPVAKLKNFEVQINKAAFGKDPNGDKHVSRLVIDVTVKNHTDRTYGFSQMAVVSDRNVYYYPDALSNNVNLLVKNKVKPHESGQAYVVYDVAGKQHKYWLVLMDPANQTELNRVPIN